MDSATLQNTSDRDVTLNGRDVEDPARRVDYTVPAGGSVTMPKADAVAFASTRDYLNVSDVAAGEVVEPAISGIALGVVAGHTTVAASESPARVPETTTVVPDAHAEGIDDGASSLVTASATDAPPASSGETDTSGGDLDGELRAAGLSTRGSEETKRARLAEYQAASA